MAIVTRYHTRIWPIAINSDSAGAKQPQVRRKMGSDFGPPLLRSFVRSRKILIGAVTESTGSR
jgi:hypothetical protein